jgi:hypothetical protein
MKKENWKKLANDLRAENKDLKAQLDAIDNSHEDNTQLRVKIGELMQKVDGLERKNVRAERAIKDNKDQFIYVTGILSVLKRLSGLYPEEQMTHEEFTKNERGAYREILSEVDLPF